MKFLVHNNVTDEEKIAVGLTIFKAVEKLGWNMNDITYQPVDDDLLWDINDVSEFTHLSTSTLRGYVRSHRVPYIKFGGSGNGIRYRFRPEEIKTWFKKRKLCTLLVKGDISVDTRLLPGGGQYIPPDQGRDFGMFLGTREETEKFAAQYGGSILTY